MTIVETAKAIGAQKLGRSVVLAKKFAPEILTGVGIVGLVTAGVFAAKNTLKLPEVVKEFEQNRFDIAEMKATGSYGDDTKQYKKDVTRLYLGYTGELTKIYAGPVALGAFSVASLVGGHGILRKRNVALLAAYKTLETGFNEYRKRVIEELGEEKDYQFANGFRQETVTDEKTGKKTKQVIKDPNGYSMYAKAFDESNPNWKEEPQYNLLFLKSQQLFANQLLVSRGYVLLNEIYEALGFEQTSAGAVVGWTRDGHAGDHVIDFGIFDGDRERSRAFVNGDERNIWLDFNVDGLVSDLIDEFSKRK